MNRTCRVCGCTDEDCSQCIEAQGFPCHWIENDLCSRCAESPVCVDNKGRGLFISQGIGTQYFTAFRKDSGSIARVKSSYLPLRLTRESAKQDLHEQAMRKGWKLITS